MTDKQPIIEIKDLTKHYPGVKAVNGISFRIPRGRCFGLLGPNGAGKTTTVEIMEGVQKPTSGDVLYKGEPLGERFRDEAGIQFQSTVLQDFLTVREVLEQFQSFYPTHMDIDELIRLCNLEDYLDRDNRKLSGGQRQRLLLAIALINDPEIVFLDEPTTGLDPQARRNFWELIELVKERGKTIILTTHYMEEAYVLCDEIAIVDHGRVIAQDTPDALLKQHFNDVILQIPRHDIPENQSLPENARESHDNVIFHSSDVNASVNELIQRGIRLDNLRIRERTLEDLFLELTGRELRA
ncbi:MAG: ABC transporter ATP-binding protein [Gammaproteobacteria bacterium]|nr:ABC transporter ATP-binding protein [Gammaproteobacteria bacterium]